MIFWVTDNKLSKIIASSFPQGDVEIKHISKFDDTPADRGIFYGLLRGCTRAMHILKHRGIEFFYVDNGYFDAEYVDKNMMKRMDGTYRFCKSGILGEFKGKYISGALSSGRDALLLKPSPWAANYFDTTPEDWVAEWAGVLTNRGYSVRVRDKNSSIDIDQDIKSSGLVLSFNSIAVLKGIEFGIPSYDSNGMFKNARLLKDPNHIPRVLYDYEDIKDFFSKRQFKLEQFKNGDHRWIIREYL